MTDREIIQGLIARDNGVTRQFFYERCRPLLTAIMRVVFPYPVEYDEMVGELYGHLMDDDAARLRKFGYRSSVYQWLKVVATRFFIHRRDAMIENASKEPPYEQRRDESCDDSASRMADRMDVERMLGMMDNRRYAEVIRRLVLEEADPAKYAVQIGVSVDNLYNIKKRAMAALARIATKYYSYGS